mgnify:CR=1 FL=1
MQQTFQRTAYLVLGMHRSGTSATAQLLALAGENIPVLYWPDKTELGRIVGTSRRGALALTDAGFAQAIQKVLA